MQKKLTISIDEKVYQGLYEVVGPGKIGKFIEKLVSPYVLKKDLEKAYAEMAKDQQRESESEAEEWSESLIGDLDQ